MPAHIGIRDKLNAAVGFLDQNTRFTSYGRMMHHMRNVPERVNQGATDNGVSANVVLEMMKARARKRELAFTTYEKYRAYMDTFHPRLAFRNRHSGYTMKVQGTSKAMADTRQFDQKGFEKFKKEWTKYLDENTIFDGTVKQYFKENWTVMLIMRDNDKRIEQLKRIEGTKPGRSHPVILWTLD